MSTTQNVSKPFAGYEDHDACVRDNPDKEDPDAFCAWLAEQAKDALSDPNAETVLTALTTEFVSSVDEPAQRSEWLIFKDATTDRRKASTVERPFVFADRAELAEKAAEVDVRAVNDDGERQVAYAAVLVPNEVDRQGDVIPPYVIERAADEYMAEFRKMDSDHDLEDGAGTPVQSWTLKQDTTFELPDGETVTYPTGTWIIGKRFVDDEWERVKAGELRGFSIYGGAQAIDVDELIDQVESVNRRATKGVDGSGSAVSTMLDALQDAASSDVPEATLADRIQAAKGELPDDDAERVVEMLRAAADVVEQATHDGDGGEPGDEDEPDEDAEQSAKQDGNETMSDEDTPDDGGTNEAPDDGSDGDTSNDDVAEGIDELKSMVKGVDEKIDDHAERLDDLEDDVETLKGNVDVDEPAPGNDRLNEEDDEDARLKSVAKDAAREAVAELAGVDGDDADDPEIVRKGLREQVGAGDDGGDDEELSKESYSGIFDDEDAVAKASHGNARLAEGDD